MKYSKIFLVILLFFSLFNGCIHQKSFKAETYFKEFTVEFEGIPLLGNPVNVVCTLKERDFASNVVLEVILPEGFELVDGTLKWEGYLDPNQIKTHVITVKAVKPGKWTISAWAGPSYYPHYDAESLYYCSNVTTIMFLFMLPTYPGVYLLPCMATKIKNSNTFFYHIMHPQLKTPFIYSFKLPHIQYQLKIFLDLVPLQIRPKKLKYRSYTQ